MKLRRRDFWKPMLGLGAIAPLSTLQSAAPSHTAVVETIDPKDCILVVKVHYALDHENRTLMHEGLKKWKEDYPQLRDLPIIVADSSLDVEIIRRGQPSKI